MMDEDARPDVFQRAGQTHREVLREYIHQVDHPHRIGVHVASGRERTRVCPSASPEREKKDVSDGSRRDYRAIPAHFKSIVS
jgi:hypothetical protein